MARRPSTINQARKLLARGSVDAAIELLVREAEARPNDPRTASTLGSALLQRLRFEDAAHHLQRARSLARRDTACRRDLTVALQSLARYDEAREVIDEALAIAPTEPTCLAVKGELLGVTGDFEGSASILLPLIESGNHDWRSAAAFARVCSRIDKRQLGIDAIEHHLPAAPPRSGSRRILLFRLASLLDAEGRYDDAFAAATEANQAHLSSFDPLAHHAAIDRAIQTWTKPRVEDLQAAGVESDLPVFIVGMPRSGTSLVEQVAATHPRVFGADELPDIHEAATRVSGGRAPLSIVTTPEVVDPEAVTEEAERYIEHLEELAPSADRITDKQPMNTLHLGLIAAMLPTARVVQVERDPLDTCLSCYMNDFVGIPFAYSLEHLAAYYADSQRLLHHWRDQLDLPVLDVEYEEFVSGQPEEAKRLIDFLGLDWDPACEAPHKTERTVNTVSNEQVRRPIYRSSVRRWTNYATHLQPLRDQLRSLGVEMQDEAHH